LFYIFSYHTFDFGAKKNFGTLKPPDENFLRTTLAQTMFCQSQAYPTENKPFFLSKNSQRCSKTARIAKSGIKKAKVATLLHTN